MSELPDESSGFRMAVAIEGGMVLAGMLLAWLFDIAVREQMPTDGRQLAWSLLRGFIATLPMLVLFWALVHSKHPACRELREQIDRMVGELFPSGSVSQLALVAALAGVGEELLFRGILQTLLVRWTTPWIGLVVASVLFGLAHAMSRLYFALAALIGFYLGGLMLFYGDLLAPMIAHAVYDFLALIYLTRRRMRPAPESQ